jgi:hypothetical protein
MLRLIGLMIKICVFSLIVLLIGNSVRWRGRTISDQVRTHLAHADPVGIVSEVRVWAEGWLGDFSKKEPRSKGRSPGGSAPSDSAATDDISVSERQKLRALIRDLNNPHD